MARARGHATFTWRPNPGNIHADTQFIPLGTNFATAGGSLLWFRTTLNAVLMPNLPFMIEIEALRDGPDGNVAPNIELVLGPGSGILGIELRGSTNWMGGGAWDQPPVIPGSALEEGEIDRLIRRLIGQHVNQDLEQQVEHLVNRHLGRQEALRQQAMDPGIPQAQPSGAVMGNPIPAGASVTINYRVSESTGQAIHYVQGTDYAMSNDATVNWDVAHEVGRDLAEMEVHEVVRQPSLREVWAD